MIKNIVKIVIPAIAAILTIRILEALTRAKLSMTISTIIASIVAVVFTYIANELVTYIYINVRFVRKLCDPRARFEGHWVVDTQEQPRMPYVHVSIEYNYDDYVYTYKGTAFDNTFKVASWWNCDDLDINPSKSEVIFMCDTSIVGHEGAITKAFGYVVFDRPIGKYRTSYYRGRGYYTVIGRPQFQGYFTIKRIDRKFIKKLTGHRSISTDEDIRDILKKIYADRSIAVTSPKEEAIIDASTT